MEKQNLDTEEADVGRSQLQGQPELHSENLSQKKKKNLGITK
jgi:hypothetical protein